MADDWLAGLDDADRAAFIADMRRVLDEAARSGDLRPVDQCIREWQATGRALADPAARAVLTAPALPDEDFTEVDRPGG